jgi:hypothetical protein
MNNNHTIGTPYEVKLLPMSCLTKDDTARVERNDRLFEQRLLFIILQHMDALHIPFGTQRSYLGYKK